MTDDKPQTLRDVALLAVTRNGGSSGRGLHRAAKARGMTLSYTTVSKIIAGTYLSDPSNETIEALASLAGIPASVAYEAASLPIPMAPLANQLPEGADTLSPEQRRLVIDAVSQFAALNRALTKATSRQDVKDDGRPPMTPAGDDPAPIAPRRISSTSRVRGEAAERSQAAPTPQQPQGRGRRSPA